jgi:hypothetical protein
MSIPRPLLLAVLLAGLLPIPLSGCGSAAAPGTQASSTSAQPESPSEPLTPQQQRVQQGARLIVSLGCAACHLMGANHDIGPSFIDFAGHDVTLADGRRVLVDERFLREALLHPRRNALRRYDPTPMLAAVARLHLGRRPAQVAALVAFIEQIGPEPG